MHATLAHHGRTATVTVTGKGALTPETRKGARLLAQRTVGVVGVSTPEEVSTGKRWSLAFAVSERALAARKVVPATPGKRAVADPAPTGTDDRAAYLAREVARLTAEIARLTGTDVPTESVREVPAFLRKREDVTCATCQDFGRVRAHGPRAGQPYRTQAGADAAHANGNAVKCPSHKRARKSA
jgi:hypothetical protein